MMKGMLFLYQLSGNYNPYVNFHHSDLEGESQATQLLEGVLDRGVEPFQKSTHVQDRTQGNEDLTRKDASSGLSPPRGPNIPPVYHFHGLAATQTQIYEDEGPEANSGSQKENIDGNAKESNEEEVRGTTLSTDTRRLSPQNLSSKGSPTRASHKGQSAQVFSRVTKVGLQLNYLFKMLTRFLCRPVAKRSPLNRPEGRP